MTQVRINSVDKREAILKAATGVFARNGYFSSKVSDIAKAAGVADGTVYLYFKSKEDILHSIFDRTMAEGIELAKTELAKCAAPGEKLCCLAKLHLARLGADRDLAIVFQVELRGSTKFMEEFSAAGFGEYLNLIRAIFEEGQAAGEFRKELHPKTCAKIFYGALDEMATNWILSEKGYELVPLSEAVLDVFLNGVSVKK